MSKVCPVLQVHESLGFALCSVDRAKILLGSKSRKVRFLSGANEFESDCLSFPANPICLKTIDSFCERVYHAFCNDRSKVVVICSGNSAGRITNSALLVGAFMILRFHCTVEQLVAGFQPVWKRFALYDEGISISDCWEALRKASTLGWLSAQEVASIQNSVEDGGFT